MRVLAFRACAGWGSGLLEPVAGGGPGARLPEARLPEARSPGARSSASSGAAGCTGIAAELVAELCDGVDLFNRSDPSCYW